MNISIICTLTLVALSGLAHGSTDNPTPTMRVFTSSDNAPETRSEEHLQFDSQFKEEIQSLLNWAKYLSGYELNVAIPTIRFETRDFFVTNACAGREDCRVIGWYNDRMIIYIDDSLRSLDSLFNRSLVVHELVHYLQHVSGRYPELECENFVKREREAYAAQQQFFIAYGAMPGIQTHYFSCNQLNSGEFVLAHGQ